MPRGLRLRKRIERARQGLSGWYAARKEAVRLYRDKDWSFAKIARLGNTTRQWVQRWWTRFVDGGKHWTCLKDRSSRPHRVHTKRHAYEDAILDAKDRYPHFGAKKLRIVADIPLSHTTIHRVLREHGRVDERETTWRQPQRFARPYPNYLWQMDITQLPLGDGSEGFVLSILDDHSRMILASRVFDQALTMADVFAVLRPAIQQWGKPLQILTDRGCQFHTNGAFPSLFTQALAQNGIRHILARPRHPQTLGKLERWHRSFKEEWCDRRDQPEDAAKLQAMVNAWVDHYNTVRPHCALDYGVPVDAYMGGFLVDDVVNRVVNEVS